MRFWTHHKANVCNIIVQNLKFYHARGTERDYRLFWIVATNISHMKRDNLYCFSSRISRQWPGSREQSIVPRLQWQGFGATQTKNGLRLSQGSTGFYCRDKVGSLLPHSSSVKWENNNRFNSQRCKSILQNLIQSGPTAQAREER